LAFVTLNSQHGGTKRVHTDSCSGSEQHVFVNRGAKASDAAAEHYGILLVQSLLDAGLPGTYLVGQEVKDMSEVRRLTASPTYERRCHLKGTFEQRHNHCSMLQDLSHFPLLQWVVLQDELDKAVVPLEPFRWNSNE
jgi:hypothetical protein